MATHLSDQIQFLLEADKLKEIERRSYLVSGNRKENSAEHSWHLALMSMVLSEYANESIDRFKVLRMLIVHDLVEIDAGDTFCYDTKGNSSKAAREEKAAERIFGILPDHQGKEFRELWEEFEARQTPEARFAAALDRLMPLLHNLKNHGRSWQENGVTADQVYQRNQHMAEGSQTLWNYIKAELDQAVAAGVLPTRVSDSKNPQQG